MSPNLGVFFTTSLPSSTFVISSLIPSSLWIFSLALPPPPWQICTEVTSFLFIGGPSRCEYKRRSVESNGSNKRGTARTAGPGFPTCWCTSKNWMLKNQPKASSVKNIKGLLFQVTAGVNLKTFIWRKTVKEQQRSSLWFQSLKDFSSKCRLRVPDGRVNLRVRPADQTLFISKCFQQTSSKYEKVVFNIMFWLSRVRFFQASLFWCSPPLQISLSRMKNLSILFQLHNRQKPTIEDLWLFWQI